MKSPPPTGLARLDSVGHRPGRQAVQGMTLIEVVTVIALLSVVTAGFLLGVSAGNRLNYANAQRMVAFGLCRDLLEQMRSTAYTNVTAATFPAEDLQLTHLGGSDRVPLMCQRTCRIVDRTNPERKHINIIVSWTYTGHSLQESLDAIIYNKYNY